jgi:hypothetical protein
MVESLAPPAPDCFDSRLQWLEWLSSAAEAQKKAGIAEADQPEAGPLIFEAGRPVRFNFGLSYCMDCSTPYARAMQSRGRCNPSHLKQFSLEQLVSIAQKEGETP